MYMKERRIVIVGGGFAGVKTALELSKKNLINTKITLISDRGNFEYHGALYRLVTGGSPMEVCIPIRNILNKGKVDFVTDSVVKIQEESQEVIGSSGSTYKYDTLVLGLGSETNYFGVPGLREYSHGMKTVSDALRLKKHINSSLEECATLKDKGRRLCASKFVVVGGGATGVELAAELIVYARKKAREYSVNSSLVSVSIIEAAPRLLPAMSEDVSIRVERQVRSLGINVHLNRSVLKEELTGVAMRDMELKSSTVIWTAGVAAHHLNKDLSGATFDKQGRVHVDKSCIALGYDNVFVIGDGAATQYSGMAQTALEHAKIATRAIVLDKDNTGVRHVIDPKPIWAIPVGGKWSATVFGPLTFYGYSGWILRRLADLVVFVSFLPVKKAWGLFCSKV